MFGRWIRKRALLGICALFAISSRTVATDSTAVEAGTTCIIPERETLKDTLESLSALKNSQQFQVKVVDALETRISKFLNDVDGNAVLSADLVSKVKSTISEDLKVVLDKAYELRNVILKSPTNPPSPLKADSTECPEKFAEYLLNVLPHLQNTLSYLVFEVNEQFRNREGAKWVEMPCNGDKGKKLLDLKKWLTMTVDSCANLNVSMLPGGYLDDELSDKKGSELASKLVGFVYPRSGEGVLPTLLHKLFYITPFTRANTAAFLPYAVAFCRSVISEQITSIGNQRVCPKLKSVCGRVSENIDHLITHQNGVDSTRSVLYFNGIEEWNHTMFGETSDNYVTWMKNTLTTILQQLSMMHVECRKWGPSENTHTARTGAFSFGFIYGPAWKTSKATFPASVEKLIANSGSKGCLRDLLNCLSGSCSNPEATIDRAETPEQTAATETAGTGSDDASNMPQTETTSLASNTSQQKGITNDNTSTAAGSPTANLTGAVNAQGGNSDVKKSPFFTGGIIAIVVVVALVALGRIINVNGDALNGYSRIHDTNSPSTHREAVSFSDQLTDEALLITGIKVVDMLAFYARGGKPGRFVELQDTISGVKEILDGECDDMPEMAFYMVGGLQEAKEKAAEMSKTK
ncbi:ATP synthase F1 beta chain, putative [Babesia caballi]|uniref:ATP synthase subunit beta, mitochondrial n=1 Tax=Babesia caballi TaxID=5871 RepID=A0AAV4M1X8_BABCB|nr:ATP synthase F1 beta chain, putative [Babesia caballi]